MAERTEAPTPRRREEARQKGQGVGRSWEFSMGLTLGVGILALSSLLPGAAATISAETRTAIVGMSSVHGNGALLDAVGRALTVWIGLVLPLALLVAVAGVAGNLVSGGLVLSPKAVRFDLSRINPLSGLKRLVDRQALIRLGMSTAKLAILAVISWQVFVGRVGTILTTEGSSVQTIAGSCLDAILQLGLTITILLAAVALVDFVVQRRRAMESLRMTKDEVRQEYKESEGDPQIRNARRRRARQLAFARMMDAVPTADVVVTNPTTYAVALKYDSLTMRAPRIVAKGQRLMAERIKTIAREHHVPIVEDKPIARALFTRPIGAEVPAHLYRAVARLLVLVHQARFGVTAGRGGGRATASRVSARAAMRRWSSDPAWAFATQPEGPSPWWAEAAASVGDRTGDEAFDGTGPAMTSPDVAADGGAADEEFGDLSADEIAELEAGLDDAREELARGAGSELDTDPDPASADEERER